MSHIRSGSGYPFENVYAYSRAIRAGNHVFVSGTTARSPDLEGDAYAQTKAALAIIAYRKPFYQVLSLEPHQDSVGEPLPPRTGQALSLSEEGSNLPCQDTLAF